MNRVEGRTFSGLRVRDGITRVIDTEFHRCCFNDCLVSTEHAESRPLFQHISMFDSEEINSQLSESVFEEIEIDGLKTKDLFIVSDCAFRNVILKGKIGSIKISNGYAGRVRKRPKLQQALDDANKVFYSHVDWALDISAAEFQDFSLSGVPLSLLRLDHETQVVLPQSLTTSGSWRSIPEFVNIWGSRIDALLKVGRGPELLLVAAKGHRDFKDELNAINALRKASLL